MDTSSVVDKKFTNRSEKLTPLVNLSDLKSGSQTKKYLANFEKELKVRRTKKRNRENSQERRLRVSFNQTSNHSFENVEEESPSEF